MGSASRILPSFRHGNDVLAIGEDIAGARVFLRAQAVDVRSVRDLDDLIAFHDIAADARDPAIGLVVDEDIAPVVSAVGERHVRMVGVAVDVNAAAAFEELFAGGEQALSEDLAALVGEAPSGRAVAVEDGNAHELAHGWKA